ncbi:1-deoxy-D-xylulose-5-phosphate reductoisomerase [Candidatus Marinimicrobia bacterium]|nr:1-deoxy-D-xylulose-5-phosphate reductoisomerase [Candidatus Neomarinimicrobiota bacterium]
MKNVVVMGSTGSVGIQSLDVISKNKSHKVIGLSCYSNADLLFEQTKEYLPNFVAIEVIDSSHNLFNLCKKNNIKLITGNNASCNIPFDNLDLAINAIVGTAGLKPTIELVNNGVDIALSNKESLVLGGHIIMPLAQKNNVNIIPVDSEHSAIFQCLNGENHKELKKIILTGSGGPFLETPIDKFNTITPDQALKHPNWDMGAKISIDSATMMNKALELIEALWLFNIKLDKIQITIHPQSIVHSMVEFVDGSYKAHLGLPDMKVPIQYALTFPNRKDSSVGSLDFENLNLDFRKPDLERYPILSLVEELINLGGNRVAVMSMANDYVVKRFLDRKISFNEIFYLIQKVVNEFASDDLPSLEELFILDKNIELYLNSN